MMRDSKFYKLSKQKVNYSSTHSLSSNQRKKRQGYIKKKTSFLAVIIQVLAINKVHVHSSSTKELARRPKNGTSKWSKVSTRDNVISVRYIFRGEQVSRIGSSRREETLEDSPSW
jgi:hypothetical protein